MMSNEEYKLALERKILKNLDMIGEKEIPQIRLSARLQIKKDWKELYDEEIDYSFFENLLR